MKDKNALNMIPPTPSQIWDKDRERKTTNTKAKVMDIPITDVNVEKQIIREAIDDDHIIELSNSIARNGLLEPIVVEIADKGYNLVAGFHRLIATHRLNWNTITASVREHDNQTPLKALSLTENIIRRDLTLAEECEAVKGLYEEEKLSMSQICSLLGKGRAWVEKRLAAPNLPFEVREALFDGVISMGVAEIIGGIDEPGTRNDILNKAVYAKMSVTETKQLTSLYQEAPSQQEAIEKGLSTYIKQQRTPKAKRTCEACGEGRDISELQPVWVCRYGCNEERLKRTINDTIKQKGGDNGRDNGKANNRQDDSISESKQMAGIEC